MFIKTTKNSKSTTYYHLVESYRSEGKVKQRTLMSLGRVEDGKLDSLAEAISKHTDKLEIFSLAKDVDVKNTYHLGPLLVINKMMDELGISKCLQVIQAKHPKLEFDLQKIVFTQLCSRFLKPVSKLALYDNWLQRMYPQMIDHDIALQHIYRSLDFCASTKKILKVTCSDMVRTCSVLMLMWFCMT